MTVGRTPRGRRAGRQPTREQILAAARRGFATRGYAGTTIRSVAADAGVDPALVLHYFGTKADLFAAAAHLPLSPTELVAGLVAAPPHRLGEAIARVFVRLGDDPDALAAWVAMIRAATADGQAAALLRDFLGDVVLGPVAAALVAAGIADAPLRMTLVASQVVGLGIARHVVGVEPLASAPDDEIVAAVAPTLQRYLTGDIAVPAEPGRGY